MEELHPGTRLENGVFVVKEDKVVEDKEVPGDERARRLMQELVNSICPFIKMTVDFPSANIFCWMPILDLQVQVGGDKTIDYKPPECLPCMTGGGRGGLHHHRAEALYRGVCNVCEEGVVGEEGKLAEYWGESGDSVFARGRNHLQAIRSRDIKNAFAKHLRIHS